MRNARTTCGLPDTIRAHSGGLPSTPAYFTHLYLGRSEDVYQPWPDRPKGCPELWQKPFGLEPYELPEDFSPYTKKQVLDYLAYIDSLVDPTVGTLDLEAQDTGISWYKNMGKLSHELMTCAISRATSGSFRNGSWPAGSKRTGSGNLSRSRRNSRPSERNRDRLQGWRLLGIAQNGAGARFARREAGFFVLSCG